MEEEQFNFFTPPYCLHRNNDPKTSVAAANSLNITKLEQLVYEAIKSFGNAGATVDDVRRKLPEVRYDSVNPRFAPLEKKGYIKQTGGTRSGNSTRHQRIFVAIR